MTAVLRCGVVGLSPAELSLVRILLRLYKHSVDDFRWILVETAPYDALMVDWKLGEAVAPGGIGPSVPTLMVGPSTMPGLANMLTRPIRSELMEAWLQQTQRDLLARGQSAIGNALPPTTVTVHGADFAQASAPRLKTPTDVAAGNASQATADAALYKLLRWPPAAMLRNDPTQIRMATVLSRRAVTVSELAQLSQYTLDTAHAFVVSMRGAGLLTMPTGVASASARSASSPAAATSAYSRTSQKIERSLMSRIRLRLGL